MRALALGAFILLGACGPSVVVVRGTDPDVGVATALRHTVLMTEGCTAVDIGRGLVLTAQHCVDENLLGDELSVGTLIYASTVRDFAVLFDTSRLGNRAAVMRAPVMGEHLYAVGYPVQLATDSQELTVTDGVFAGPLGSDGSFRFTAPIYFGNSGGGVWANDGSLVGLSVSGYLEMPGMNFLISSADILPWLPR
jgi:hypothetical protein